MCFPMKWKKQIILNGLKDATDVEDVGRLRRFTSQFIASTAANWLIFDMGICSFFPGIVIPALVGIKNQHNVGEVLSISAHESSWLGSVGNVVAPIGCILSAFITDSIGRKRSMILSNAPLLIAWVMLCRATSTWEIFTASALLGLGTGLMEGPVIAYVGECSEPEFRSFLMTYTYIGMTFGSLFVSVLNTMMPWRMVALVCIFVPIANTILICCCPESPLYLLSKNRPNEALKALRWLRGWISDAAAIDEFHALQRYNERTKSCVICIKNHLICTHPPATVVEKLTQMKRKQSLKPLAVVLILMFILQIARTVTIRPYIVQIFSAYKTPVPPDQAAAILNLLNNVSNFVFLFTIYFLGKRRLYLIMLTIVFLCTLTTAVYGFCFLPSGFNSLLALTTYTLDEKWLAYVPFACILIASFCTNCGVSSVPSQIMSELLTFKIRGFVSGLIAAFVNIINFVIAKEYYQAVFFLTLPGTTLFTATLLGLGLVTLYLILPETKNRTLEDIELHYADNSKKITNRKILKNGKAISVIEFNDAQ